MMHELIKIGKPFADDIRFGLSWGLLALGLCCLIFAIGIIWEWKETKPKDEKFWFVCGIFFHWLSTINARALFLLMDSGSILVRTEHFLTALNLCFALAAGSFYFRALTQHWKSDLWKWATGATFLFSFAMYGYRVMT